jgi:hypothetical protein
MNNKTQRTVDLKKVQWADYFWINGKGDRHKYKPNYATANGIPYEGNELAPHHTEHPGETMVERAWRLGVNDIWKPVCILHITANRCLTYTGDKATSIWKAYNAHIYGKR